MVQLRLWVLVMDVRLYSGGIAVGIRRLYRHHSHVMRRSEIALLQLMISIDPLLRVSLFVCFGKYHRADSITLKFFFHSRFDLLSSW